MYVYVYFQGSLDENHVPKFCYRLEKYPSFELSINISLSLCKCTQVHLNVREKFEYVQSSQLKHLLEASHTRSTLFKTLSDGEKKVGWWAKTSTILGTLIYNKYISYRLYAHTIHDRGKASSYGILSRE